MARVNSTVVFSLDTVQDLALLARTYRNVSYEPNRFRAAIVRRPGASLLVFPNGRCVGTGRYAEQYFGHIYNAKVVNQVYAGKLTKRIDLYRLQREYGHLFFYEPEIFSGGRLSYAGATVVIFFTGSYFITGVTDDTLVEQIQTLLLQYGTD